MPYKKVLYTIRCPRCNKEYQVLPQAYFRKQKDPKYGSYCTSCRAKVLWEEKSEEEKKQMQDKATAATKKFYSTANTDRIKEIKDKRKQGVQRYWNSLTEEEKSKISEKRSKDRKDFLNSLTDDQMKEIGKKISKVKQQTSSNMSQEELENRKKKKQEEREHYWNSLSDEEKEKINNMLRENNKSYWENITDEDRKERSEQMTERNKLFWTNSSKNVINDRINKLIKNGEIYRSNLTDEERSKLVRKRLSSSVGKNNFHQKFEKYFSNSVLCESYYIKPEEVLCNNSVVHSWDYGIYDKTSNELVMVVDLDGSYYHADNCDYDGLHSKEEYDERRSESIPYDRDIKHSIIQESKFSKCFEDMLKILIMNYDEYIEIMFKQFRSMPFPEPQYTDDELIKSMNSLIKMNCNDKYHQDISLNTRIGDRIIQHFHPSIYRAHRRGCISPYEAWYNDDLLKECIRNRVIYQSYLNPNKILQGFNVSKIAPKVSVFSAGRAKLIINKYLKEFDTIFDPFSGFSGRMLGAISLGKKYIGRDISEVHVSESNRIIEFLKKSRFDVQAEIEVCNLLGETSWESFPCLFTCPPYGNKEQWMDVPMNTMNCDKWIDECLKRFKCKRYVFVVDYTEKYKNNIVEVIDNIAHIGKNNEYLIIIDK